MLLETAQKAETLVRRYRETTIELEAALDERFDLDLKIDTLRKILRETEEAIKAL